MQKLFESTISSELSGQEDQEQTKRFYRYITETARRLDESRGRALTIRDLFTPLQLSHRARLREYCEKLIFSHPTTYGPKCEELLWRKAYYDVVSTAKRLKQRDYSNDDKAHLTIHINAGIGHYHHTIFRLQLDYNVNLFGLTDFSVISNQSENVIVDEKVLKWAEQSLHRCLMYLGDLSRYRLDVTSEDESILAVRYYVQAFNLNPELGIPHNQLGSLVMQHNYGLDAAYHYMRCLSCLQPFDGSEGNLIRLLDKNINLFEEMKEAIDPTDAIANIKRLIVRFLFLIDGWFFDKNIPNVNQVCHQTLIDLQNCLGYPKPLSSVSDDSGNENSNKSELLTPQYLRPDIIFKMCVMCLLCITKLDEKKSPKLSAIVAFTLAIYSQLVKEVIQHVQESVLNLSIVIPSPINGRKKKIVKLRRRRKRLNSSEDSDLSDNDEIYSSSDSNSDISELDEKNDTSDENSESEDSDKNVKILVVPTAKPETIQDSLKKVRRLDPNDILELIADEGYLQSIKILSDWLQSDIEIIKDCGQSSRLLIQRIVELINLINIDTKKRYLDNVNKDLCEIVETMYRKIALPEDFVLKNFSILDAVQKDIDWNGISSKSKLYLPKDEALIRLNKLVGFVHFLTGIPETGVKYSDKEKSFIVLSERCELAENGDCCIVQPVILKDDVIHKADGTGDPGQQVSRGELMKNMGQLWLAAEVRDLECRVRGRPALSAYLVLDTDALILHTNLVKQLVFARKFIVVVPAIVVSGLDELKRETGKARDAIRWLEAQFQRGNRFLRAQRNHEHAAIPLIKYPKRKDKNANIYIQIIECCYFLAKQQTDSADLVTLLTGKPPVITAKNQSAGSKDNAVSKEISYTGLAQTAGIALEHITTFNAKWKKTLKGQR